MSAWLSKPTRTSIRAELLYSIVVLSKWGYDGEYPHKVSYVPDALGSPEEFWTDRKSV
jgi:hypothetical protein